MAHEVPKIAAPQFAPTIDAEVPGFIEEGEIVYGNQGFDHFQVDTVSGLLESGQAFWDDIVNLNKGREQLLAQEKTDTYNLYKATQTEKATAAAEKQRDENRRKLEELLKLLKDNKIGKDDLFGLLEGATP